MPENEILNPSLQGLGTDPFGLQGYTYSTSLWNKKNARNAAKAEAAYNAKTNYAYWVANNLYNSPAAQMARFEDAGLNPNLIYGKENNVVAGNSPNAHGQVDNTNPIEQTLGALSTFVGAVSQLNGLKLQNAQVQKAQNEADLSSVRTENAWFDSLMKSLDAKYNFIFSKLPNDFSSMTSEQRTSWLDDNFPRGEVSIYGERLPSGRQLFHSLQRSDFDKLAPYGLFYKFLEGSSKGVYADELFKSLLDLRKSQKENVKAQKEYTESRKEYQDYYNKHILPILQQIQETNEEFQEAEKSTGILGTLLRLIFK